MFRKFTATLAIALALYFATPPPAAKGLALFTEQTTTGSSTEVVTANATSIRIRILDTLGTGTSTTIIKVRNAGDTEYFTVATITSPTTDGELWLGSGADFVVVEVTACSSCSISSTISAFVGDKRVI